MLETPIQRIVRAQRMDEEIREAEYTASDKREQTLREEIRQCMITISTLRKEVKSLEEQSDLQQQQFNQCVKELDLRKKLILSDANSSEI